MKFRSSQLGEIIRKPKARKPITGELFLRELHWNTISNSQKTVTSKYFENGNLNEQAGLQMLQDALYPGKFVTKYPAEEVLENDYVRGHPDCVAPDGILYDIKNAYEKSTFDKAELSWNYKWQIKSYLWLTGKKHGRLMYCLNDLPDHLLVKEKQSAFYKGGFISEDQPGYIEECENIERYFDYSKLDLFERFKIWDVFLTEDDVKIMIESCKTANEVLKSFYKERTELIETNKKLRLQNG